MEYSYLSAFLVGLLGGVHCVGMCGGIVAALSFTQPGITQPGQAAVLPKTRFSFLLSYNLGRISSYVIAGLLVGWLSQSSSVLFDLHEWRITLTFIAGAFLVAMGLYLAGWWYGLLKVEKLGGYAWRYIQPLSKRFIPPGNAGHAFIVGMIWGWLPCGLIYSVLIWALASGNAIEGGLLMLSFALGTLPNLLAMGVMMQKLQGFMRQAVVKRIAGSLIILFGLLEIYRGITA